MLEENKYYKNGEMKKAFALGGSINIKNLDKENFCDKIYLYANERGEKMKDKCIVGKINQICNISNKYSIKRINEENLPILRNHIPLFYILSSDGMPLLFNEIASIWNISKSSLSDIIVKYENQGLIKKCSCSEDKRSIYISLTPEAVIIKEKLYEIERDFLNLLLKNFDKDQRNIFENDIDKALSNIEKML